MRRAWLVLLAPLVVLGASAACIQPQPLPPGAGEDNDKRGPTGGGNTGGEASNPSPPAGGDWNGADAGHSGNDGGSPQAPVDSGLDGGGLDGGGLDGGPGDAGGDSPLG